MLCSEMVLLKLKLTLTLTLILKLEASLELVLGRRVGGSPFANCVEPLSK